MRWTNFIGVILGAASVVALPALEKRETCCCCDISQNKVVCQEQVGGCVCAAVVCPEGAPTISAEATLPTKVAREANDWKMQPKYHRQEHHHDKGNHGRQKSHPPIPVGPGGPGWNGTDPETLKRCCYDDSSKNHLICNILGFPEDCFCTNVVCPPNPPTNSTSTNSTTTVTTSPPKYTLPSPTPKPTSDLEPCCCCNPGKGAIVCEMRAADEGCFCPEVMCPPHAPTETVWPKPPAYTG